MKKRSAWIRVLMYLSVMVILPGCSFGYEGCSFRPEDKTQSEKMMEELLKQSQEDEKAGRVDDEPDLALAEGEILKVRLHYGTDTLETEAWYKVRIENQSNQWYDYVEITAYHGFGNSEKNYDDYTFFATNFNRQAEQPEYYDPATIAGTYLLTITGSNGHYVEKTLTWNKNANDGRGGFDGSGGLLTYEVP